MPRDLHVHILVPLVGTFRLPLRRLLRLAALAAVLVVCAGQVVAQVGPPLEAETGAPAANGVVADRDASRVAIEKTPLGMAAGPKENRTADGDADPPVQDAGPAASLGGGGLKLVVSLVVVVGLVLLCAAAYRKAAAGGTRAGTLLGGGRAPAGVVSVLGRYPAGKGQAIVLLQLDKRVLLLSQSSAGMRTLCELDNPEDVASILVKTQDEEGASLSKRFSAMLRRVERDPAIAGETVEVGGHRGDPLASLKSRVASLGGGREAS